MKANATTPVVFTFAEATDVRILIESGEPMFCANDVCTVLGHANPRQAIDTHCDEDDVQKLDIIDALGRTQQTNFVTEAGVYCLIFGSEKPEAKTFKRWVTHELLPQLRRVGYYGTLELKERIALGNQMMAVVDRLKKHGGDAFVRLALMGRLREICLLLGQPIPDATLLGQKLDQPSLPGL